jgi:hypothetical protein
MAQPIRACHIKGLVDWKPSWLVHHTHASPLIRPNIVWNGLKGKSIMVSIKVLYICVCVYIAVVPQMRLFQERDLTDWYIEKWSLTIANLSWLCSLQFARIEDFKNSVVNLLAVQDKDMWAILDFICKSYCD